MSFRSGNATVTAMHAVYPVSSARLVVFLLDIPTLARAPVVLLQHALLCAPTHARPQAAAAALAAAAATIRSGTVSMRTCECAVGEVRFEKVK